MWSGLEGGRLWEWYCGVTVVMQQDLGLSTVGLTPTATVTVAPTGNRGHTRRCLAVVDLLFTSVLSLICVVVYLCCRLSVLLFISVLSLICLVGYLCVSYLCCCCLSLL